MRKILFLLVLGFACSITCLAQGSIKGNIMDSSSKKPLGLATVTIFRSIDTIIITYRLSSPDGAFRVPGLPLNLNCRMVISFSGYAVHRREFNLSSSNPTLDLGTIYMMTDAKSLDEALVFAERPPVVIKQDTIEFNASAFKTLPNALVEDLLKKLPGVQVDAEGNIAVGGKRVNRILVDGKTFFGDDPKMATRNLPANVIDKVQVTDDKEELMRNGDDNLNNIGKVINITLKKGVKKGWFGKQYAGIGTDKLYEAGGIANIYRDTLQVSVLGYINNLNRAGFSFSELNSAGGFDRIRSNSASNNLSIWNSSGGGSGVSINGVNFGGQQNYGGIATSKGTGFNMNHAPNTKRSFYVQYFFGKVNIDRTLLTDTRQFNSDTVINNNTRLTGDVVTNTHNFGIGTRLKPDSVTNILINASYTLGASDEDRLSDVSSMNNKLGQLSLGDVEQNNLSKLRYYRHIVSITRLSRTKKGRRYTINHNLDINNRFNDHFTESDIRYFYPNQFDSLYGQLRNERIPRTDASAAFNFSEPITKIITFRIGGRYEYSQLYNTISTFNKNGGDEYSVPNNALSSRFRRFGNRVIVTPGIEFKWKNLTITPSIRALMQYVDNHLASLPAPIEQDQSNLLPALSIVFKQLNVNYSKDIILPNFSFLIPVRDNSNPYFIAKGNANLVPMKRNNLSINYSFSNPKKNFNAGIYANGSLTGDDVVQSITLDDHGVQTSTPVNADGSRNFNVNFNFYKQYKNNPKFTFAWNTGGNYGFNRNKLLFNSAVSWQTTAQVGNWFGLNLNWNDKIEYNTSFSFHFNFTNYTNPLFREINIRSRWIENELILRWPKHIIWETQCTYSFNSSIPQGMPKEVVRWNAAVNLTMFKNETGVIKFSVFDILNQNNGIGSWVNRNMITTNRNNVLSQYFMATFTYNVRAAGVKKKIGGRERLFFF